MAKRPEKNILAKELLGTFHITWMEQWEQDYVNEETQGYFRFEKNDKGDFHFGYVQGRMDCRYCEREGKPSVEFSWEGSDECDPAMGRGWGTLEGDELSGRIYFHMGDDSEFRAKLATGK